MEIRKAKSGDESKLIELFKHLDKETDFMIFEPGERKTTASEQSELIDKFSNSENHLLLVLSNNEGEIIGFLGSTKGQTNKTKYTASFVTGILKKYWGNNHGASLLIALEEWAIQTNTHRLEMTVIESNNRAKQLYINNGFEIEGIKKDSMKINNKFHNELYMSKLLPHKT